MLGNWMELPTQLWAVEVAAGSHWLLFKVYDTLQHAEEESLYFTHAPVRVREAHIAWNHVND